MKWTMGWQKTANFLSSMNFDAVWSDFRIQLNCFRKILLLSVFNITINKLLLLRWLNFRFASATLYNSKFIYNVIEETIRRKFTSIDLFFLSLCAFVEKFAINYHWIIYDTFSINKCSSIFQRSQNHLNWIQPQWN